MAPQSAFTAVPVDHPCPNTRASRSSIASKRDLAGRHWVQVPGTGQPFASRSNTRKGFEDCTVGIEDGVAGGILIGCDFDDLEAHHIRLVTKTPNHRE